MMPRAVRASAPLLAAAIAGAAAVFGFAPFDVVVLPIAALAVLFLLWHRAGSPARAAALGLAFGAGYFGAGVSWVYVSLHDFGDMPAPVAGFAVVLFCGFFALFPMAVGYAQGRRPAGSTSLYFLALLPGLWTAAEWVRGWIFTGFPWLAIGYSQVPASPLAGLAPVIGVYGVSLAAALIAGAAAQIILKRGRGAAAAKALIIVLIGGGLALRNVAWTAPSGEPLKVSLLQGNIEQSLKWRPEVAARTLETYLALARSAQGRLVILPETALPVFRDRLPNDYIEALTAGVKARGGDVLVGMPERGIVDGQPRYFNSVFSLGTSEQQVYRKHHLTPFGEFIPLRPLIAWIYDSLLNIPLADFAAGDPDQKWMQVAGQRVAMHICYEALFGEELIQHLPEATLLANVSNDAWFGASIGPEQHLQIAQTRALETGRPLLRATNTGVTAFIDAHGRVTARAARFVTTVLEGEVRGYTGATPYVRVGNYPAVLAAFALIALAIIRKRKAA